MSFLSFCLYLSLSICLCLSPVCRVHFISVCACVCLLSDRSALRSAWLPVVRRRRAAARRSTTAYDGVPICSHCMQALHRDTRMHSIRPVCLVRLYVLVAELACRYRSQWCCVQPLRFRPLINEDATLSLLGTSQGRPSATTRHVLRE